MCGSPASLATWSRPTCGASHQPFLLQLAQVVVVSVVGHWDVLVVPAVVPGLVPAKEQDGDSPWVEREEHTVGSAAGLSRATRSRFRIMRRKASAFEMGGCEIAWRRSRQLSVPVAGRSCRTSARGILHEGDRMALDRQAAERFTILRGLVGSTVHGLNVNDAARRAPWVRNHTQIAYD